MSSFVLSQAHINALVTAAKHYRICIPMPTEDITAPVSSTGKWVELSPVSRSCELQQIGEGLLRANCVSVAQDYNEEPQSTEGYRYSTWTGFNTYLQDGTLAGRTLAACACYRYQTCEMKDYEGSWADLVISRIRSAAERKVKGYAEEWEITD